MKLDLKNEFITEDLGTKYQLPEYEVAPAGLRKTGVYQEIRFVRGSKDVDENIPGVEGIMHENLLAMMIADLQYKQSLVPSRETAIVITKLQEAYLWLLQRQIDRKDRDVEGTYKR